MADKNQQSPFEDRRKFVATCHIRIGSRGWIGEPLWGIDYQSGDSCSAYTGSAYIPGFSLHLTWWRKPR